MTEIVKMFGVRKIRSIWDDAAENWYFSIIDVIAVLTESENPRNYWKVLKTDSNMKEMKRLQIVTV